MKRAMLAALLALSTSHAHAQAPSGESFPATITSYCLRGIGKAGVPVGPGTVAVDQDVIALWSRVTIDGLDGVYTALDTGGGVHGAHLDLWQANCQDAVDWGRQTRMVTILAP